MEEKTAGQLLAENLSFELKTCWEHITREDATKIEQFADNYKKFIDKGKTEREFTAQCLEILERKGFIDIENLLLEEKRKEMAPGSKIYLNIKGKSVIFAVLGKKPLSAGVNIVGAHVDSPRIDLKTNPLYEDGGFALFDTHYYGGIKHYQWTTIPLAMHGVIFTKDGEKRDICIGENEDDPVFVITDLLPHLAQDQMQKKASEFFRGEDLDVLAGSKPYLDENVKEKVKLTILSILNERYGVTEEAFASAEIEFVPAVKARDIGLDRSLIGAYGHDDRSCAFTAFWAALDFAEGDAPEKTVVCYLSDKEEIGSMGNTGAESRQFENFIAFLCAQFACATSVYAPSSDIDTRVVLSKSAMLSADVNAAFDPSFADVWDKKTASYCGKGIVLSKYTGRGGKYGGSDASAEFCWKVQNILSKNGVQWQFGNLGKVDKGGGGTIAYRIANLGVDVLDCGIPVLSMHAPFEIISKVDLWTTYRGYLAFLKDC
ncbi:MAG: aminopeptidase [Treponema sp.]|jgi:aspartyl aminopeptidase|nr:aminopeptidase [Treponema sp.]